MKKENILPKGTPVEITKNKALGSKPSKNVKGFKGVIVMSYISGCGVRQRQYLIRFPKEDERWHTAAGKFKTRKYYWFWKTQFKIIK